MSQQASKVITQIPHIKTLMMYRRTLKSMMRVFANDYEMFHRARIEFRKSIEDDADLRDKAEINQKLFQYEETRRFLL